MSAASGAAQERAERLAEAERAVLGSLCQPAGRVVLHDVVEILDEADFRAPRHATVYRFVTGMWARLGPEESVDPITLAAELAKAGELARVGGAAYIHELVESVPTVMSAPVYAAEVRDAALRRAIGLAGALAASWAEGDEGDAQEGAERAVADMQAARDRGRAVLDAPPLYLDDFLAEADDEPEWIVPGLLARWDRLIVTAGEGGGKSLLLRQLLMRSAAGLHPFKQARIKPVKVMLIDVENSKDQVRPWIRSMAKAAAQESGQPITSTNVVVEILQRPFDITTPADRSYLARRIEAEKPDLITIGALYKLTLAGNPNDEELARKLMAALEMLRSVSNGAAMAIEAHAPHGSQGKRDLRPIGSSLWLRWPEFGFGLSPSAETGAQEQRLMDWVPWRGSRAERDWPAQFLAGATWPWQALDRAGDAPIGAITLTDEQVAALTPEQYARLTGEQAEAF